MQRRLFLKQIACTGVFAGGLTSLCTRAAPLLLKSSERPVIIIGGGFAGAMVARTLKRLSPRTKIVLIEKNERFVPGPYVLQYVFGNHKNKDDITFGYDGLRAIGVQILHAEVQAIDPVRMEVSTSIGKFEFSKLVIATGIRPVMEEVAGLSASPQENYSPYYKDDIDRLRRKIQDFKGGNVVISIPPTALPCPPAPYEYSLLWAEHIRKNNLKAKVVLLDSGSTPQPMPLSNYFKEELDDYRDVIEYVWGAGQVTEVDVNKKQVVTSSREKYEYDVLSLIPQHDVSKFVKELDLNSPGDLFAEVDPLTMRTRKYPDIYALGDVARVPYGKSAYAANVCATMCATSIAKSIGANVVPVNHVVRVSCFPFVNSQQALGMNVEYDVSVINEVVELHTKAQVLAASTSNFSERAMWSKHTLAHTFASGG